MPTVATMARGQPIDINNIVLVITQVGTLLGAQASACGGGVPLVATTWGPPTIMTRMSNIDILESQ